MRMVCARISRCEIFGGNIFIMLRIVAVLSVYEKKKTICCRRQMFRIKNVITLVVVERELFAVNIIVVEKQHVFEKI